MQNPNWPPRALAAPRSTQLLYAAVILSAVLRTLTALLPSFSQPLLWVAAIAWVAAFWGFCVIYGPMLLRPRLKGNQPERLLRDRKPRELLAIGQDQALRALRCA